MDKPLTINYQFTYQDSSHSELDITLDRVHLEPISHPQKPASWTALDKQPCDNCPLSKEQYPHCPLAVALAPLIQEFSTRSSLDQVDIVVTTEDRTTSTKTTLQRGLSSLLGLVMATSGCPHTALFKPMARFHLPFSSSEETVYRASANYLLAQYFQQPEDQDWQLRGLAEAYQQLQRVNQGISRRLKQVCAEDATINAVVLLDLYAKDIPYSVEEALEEIKYLFEQRKP